MFENSGYFQKISELRKTNFSETHENKKFGNFHLTQGLILGFRTIALEEYVCSDSYI